MQNILKFYNNQIFTAANNLIFSWKNSFVQTIKNFLFIYKYAKLSFYFMAYQTLFTDKIENLSLKQTCRV